MSVVQISKIQIRRGKTQAGTGLPQLASGELAWSIDTAELFIGNGSVAEGAPQVGNTKILTANDLLSRGNLLTLTNHTYKALSNAVPHAIQHVLDYTANSDAFNTKHDGVTDDTIALQTAINTLFSNVGSPAYEDTADSVNNRIVLNLLPGIYKITGTIYIPSYATIKGAGANKTIINYTGNSTLFQFVNDTETPTDITATSSNTRPKNISIQDIGISIGSDAVGFKLDAVRDSTFNNIIVNGAWVSSNSPNNAAFVLNALSQLVTCENNLFKNINISGCYYGIYAKKDIVNNSFDSLYISNSYIGVALGKGINGLNVGELYGPQNTSITNSSFISIKKQAILIDNGTRNLISNINLENVGNDNNIDTPLYPQIFINSLGNKTNDIMSDRHDKLSHPQNLLFTRYVPEVSGNGEYASSTEKLILGQSSDYTPLILLPVATDRYGVPTGVMAFSIDYIYNSSFARKGVISLSCSVEAASVQLTDEYSFVGTGTDDDQVALDFKAYLLDMVGDVYTGAAGQVPYTIAIAYINTKTNDAGTLTYSYVSQF